MASVSFPSKGLFENLLSNSTSKKSNYDSEPKILFKLIQRDFAQYAIDEQIIEVCIYNNHQVEVLTPHGIFECESNLSNIFTKDQLKTYAAQIKTEDQWKRYINWRLTQYVDGSRYHLIANISILGGGNGLSKSGDSKNLSQANKPRAPIPKNPSVSSFPLAASINNSLSASLHESQPSSPVKDPEEEEMFQQYKSAADKGDAQAQYELGACYIEGKGVAKSVVEGVKWWHQAAEQNLSEAQFFLAQLYLEGIEAPKDLPQGLMLLQKAAQASYEPAKELLKFFEKDMTLASTTPSTENDINLLTELATQGRPSAQFSLGISYLVGDFVEKNPAKAVNWFRRSAEQGYIQAQAILGQCYHTGNGVSVDSTEAVKWYRKAAAQDDSASQYALGQCYYEGDGVDQDYAQALRWFLRAAGKNLPKAQYFLAICYHTGNGIPADSTEAVKWYRKAAAQDDSASQYALGQCYYKGDGIAQDCKEAEKWFKKAAALGNNQAQDFLKSKNP